MKKRCPDEEKLADYLEGRLSAEDRSDMDAHLSDCDACLERLMVGQHLAQHSEHLEIPPAPAHVTEAAVRLVADVNTRHHDALREKAGSVFRGICSKVSDYLSPMSWGDPLPAGVRGGQDVAEDYVRVRKTFREAEVEIEIEKAAADAAHVRVFLEDQAKAGGDIRVTLKKREREISSQLPDDGYVVFENIAFDHYELVFTQHGSAIGTYSFELRETRHARR